jgi:2-polyprenyl-6-methoxyphenol hydroxylase-like FAD-dependent oxidoreductase
VVIVERRVSQELDDSRAGGLHSRTIEVLDQRGIADRFLVEGQVAQVVVDISDFPTRHNYGLALWQREFERILAGWVGELGVPMLRGYEGPFRRVSTDDPRRRVARTVRSPATLAVDGRSVRAYRRKCDAEYPVFAAE